MANDLPRVGAMRRVRGRNTESVLVRVFAMNHRRESELRRFSLKIYYWNVYQGGGNASIKMGQ